MTVPEWAMIFVTLEVFIVGLLVSCVLSLLRLVVTRLDHIESAIDRFSLDGGGRYCAVLERFDAQRRVLDRIDRRTEEATEDVGLLMRGVQRMGEE